MIRNRPSESIKRSVIGPATWVGSCALIARQTASNGRFVSQEKSASISAC